MAKIPFFERARDAIGGRDPLAILARTPETLDGILRTVTVDELRCHPFPGKWSVNELLGHLADHEIVTATRLRHAIGDEDPVIDSYPQEDWVREQGHDARDPREHVALFGTMRADTLRLWKSVPPPRLDRIVTHAVRGPYTLGELLVMHAGHDLVHLEQIGRWLEAGNG